MSKSEGVDRSVWERFMIWSRGDWGQKVIAFLLILGSFVYQIWQDPDQFEFVKLIAIVFVLIAIIEEYFELRGKTVDLEKEKIKLEIDVFKVEKALQAEFIKNKHHFHYDVMGVLLSKIEDYLDGGANDSKVVKNYREMIGSILSKSKQYASMIENKYKDFLIKMLDDREQGEIPITEFNAMMIKDKLKEKPEAELKEKIEANTKAIEDFNTDHTANEIDNQ